MARPFAIAAAVATAKPLFSNNALRDRSMLIIGFPPCLLF
jgi:hypothetical protein